MPKTERTAIRAGLILIALLVATIVAVLWILLTPTPRATGRNMPLPVHPPCAVGANACNAQFDLRVSK